MEGDIFQQLQSFVPELVQSIPGIDEALGFAELINSIQSMEFSVIVFDTAPTGHTLRLLGFPELMEKAFVKLGELASSMGGAMDMMKMMNPGMDGNFMGKFDDLRAQTTAVRERFQNPVRTIHVEGFRILPHLTLPRPKPHFYACASLSFYRSMKPNGWWWSCPRRRSMSVMSS